MADIADGRCFSLHEADADADTGKVPKVGALKEASPSFAAMRQVAMRFRGLLRGADPSKLDGFLHDARRSGLRSMQQFARVLTRDIEAVRHAIGEPSSSGQSEGKINRLKTLKRAMYGRAGIELLRARMLPLEPAISAQSEADPD